MSLVLKKKVFTNKRHEREYCHGNVSRSDKEGVAGERILRDFFSNSKKPLR